MNDQPKQPSAGREHVVSAKQSAQPSNEHRVVRWRRDDGTCVHGVISPAGRKYYRLVFIDVPVRLVRLGLEEERHLTRLEGYDLRQAARTILRAGKNLGITEGAKAFLKEVLAEPQPAA